MMNVLAKIECYEDIESSVRKEVKPLVQVGADVVVRWARQDLDFDDDDVEYSEEDLCINVYIGEHKIGTIPDWCFSKAVSIIDSGCVVSANIVGNWKEKITIEFSLLSKLDPSEIPKPTANKSVGIYKISVSNHSFYIGQSNNINERIKKHFMELSVGCHHNRHLQSEWNNSGIHAFNVEVLELLNEKELGAIKQQEELERLERFWIAEYRKTGNCLNLTDGEFIETPKSKKEKKVIIDQQIKDHNKKKREEKAEVKKSISKLESLIKNQNDLIARENIRLRPMVSERDELKKEVRKFSGILAYLFLAKSRKEKLPRLKNKLSEIEDQLHIELIKSTEANRLLAIYRKELLEARKKYPTSRYRRRYY